MKYDKQQFENKLKQITTDPFKITQFNGISKPGKFYCELCKKEYTLSKMSKLLNKKGHLCSHCFASQYAEKVLQVIEQYDNLKFIQFSYKNNLHKPTIIYKCLKCGENTEKPLVEFLKYPTCIHCGFNAKRRVLNTIQQYLPVDFQLIDKYKDQYTKALFRHKCGFIFSARPKDLISGHTYCPKCSKKSSKGERKIMEFLEKEQIVFIKEKIFEWSNNKRYDFYLPEYNLLIEYNGIQHYKEVPNFFLSLKEQQEIDKWKEEKAKEHDFYYLIISYLDFDNIEDILAQRLKEST